MIIQELWMKKILVKDKQIQRLGECLLFILYSLDSSKIIKYSTLKAKIKQALRKHKNE